MGDQLGKTQVYSSISKQLMKMTRKTRKSAVNIPTPPRKKVYIARKRREYETGKTLRVRNRTEAKGKAEKQE